MFEAAAAAFTVANTAQPTATTATALTGVVIAAPLPLTSRGDALLDISLDAGAGSLTAYSFNLLSAQRHMHLRAAATRIPTMTEIEQPDAPPTQPLPLWQSLLLQEAAVELRRFNGGTLAALDVAWERSGGGFTVHPAIGDSCLHTGAVFTPPPSPLQDSQVSIPCVLSHAAKLTSCIPRDFVVVSMCKANCIHTRNKVRLRKPDVQDDLRHVSRLPAAVAAYCASKQEVNNIKWAAMGSAALRPDNSATSDYALAAGQGSSLAGMALCQLLAKAVPPMPPAVATPLDVVYVVEQRACGAALPEGALPVPLKLPLPLARLAVVKAAGGRKWLRLPLARYTSRDAPRQQSHASLRAAGGALALLQALAATNLAGSDRFQFCMEDTVATVCYPTSYSHLLHNRVTCRCDLLCTSCGLS